MKKLLYSLLLMTMALSQSLLVSCDTEDVSFNDELWKGELADAPYADDAICFDIKGQDLYKSLEITGSGLYFLTMDALVNTEIFRAVKPDSRNMPQYNVISDTFTVLAKNKFKLTGFGIVTYDPATGLLDIEFEDGSDTIWEVVVAKQVDSTALNDRLCRTWEFYAARLDFLDADKKFISTYNFTDEQVKDEFIEYFTFTRAGRMYEYDGVWCSYTWKWANVGSQIIYAKGDDYSDGEDFIQVLFNNDKMTIMEVIEFMDYGDVQDEFGTTIPSIPANALYTKLYLECRPYKI